MNKVKRLFNPLLIFCGLFITSVQSLSAKEVVPAGLLPEDVTPSHYTLEIKLDPAEKNFSGTTTIDINVSKKTKHFYLHGEDLTVKSTVIKSGKAKIAASTSKTDVTGVLKVSAVKTLKPGKYSITFEYDAPFNENLEGLYRIKDGEKFYAFTQFEAIDARHAFPSFDEPRFKTPFDVTLIIPSNLKAIANTPEKKRTDLKDGWTKIDYATSKPLPTYLVAVAAGDFDIVVWDDIPTTAVRDRVIPLRGVATKGKGGKLKYALENTQAIVESLEDYFQIPYPYEKLDILAVPDFAFGAMENAGAITYREQLLLLDENSSLGQKRSYKSVHAHELAHQWFGNLVTPIWWNDIWLNEAFATWMAATALHRRWPDEQWQRNQIANSKRVMNSDSLPSARKVRNPIESNSDIMTAFDGITYQKGGGVLTMIEAYMGAEKFRQGVQKHMENYRWGNANALDFFESIASVLPKDKARQVITSFRNFVEQAGVPVLDIAGSCEEDKTILTVEQERFAPLGTEFKEKTLWNIPACINYEIDGKTHQQCQVLSKVTQKVALQYQGCTDWVMPNAKAAGYYRFNLDADNWQALLSNLNKLDPQEANATMDSLKSSISSGKLNLQDMMKVLPATLKADSWEVKTAGFPTFRQIIRYAEDNEKPALRQMASDIYLNEFSKLGFVDNTPMDKSHTVDTARLRSGLVSFLAMTAEDQNIRKQLTDMAIEYIGYQKDGKLNDKAIIPSLRGSAIAVAVQELGLPFVEAVIKQINQSTDGTVRDALINGLTSTKDPKVAAKVLEFGFGGDTRDNEKGAFMFGMLNLEELDDMIWPWFQQNFDKVVADLPSNYRSYLPYVIPGGCSEKTRERMESFLKPKLDNFVGADKNYQQRLDSLSQCLAIKAHLKPQISELVK